MIPDESTPIKNDILIDIFAKGMLNKDEMRIIFYIIRWSWGFNGVKRRQDWTKELTKRQIADSIGMHESHLNRNINRMIIEKKIIVKEGCYQFNEHCDEWEYLPISQVLSNKKLTKMVNKTYQNGKVNLPNKQGKLTKMVSSTHSKPLQDKGLPDRKETLKETKTKETKKKISRTFEKCEIAYQLTIYLEGKIRENNKAIQKKYGNITKLQKETQIQSWCKDIDKLLRLDKANSDDVKQIIDWIVKDDFWAENVMCAKSLRKHYSRFYKRVISDTNNDPNRFDFIDEEESLIE
jgi:hypothetical protein